SAAFFEDVVPSIWRQGGHDVLTHHLPRSYSAKLLAIADHLAASEREDEEAADVSPDTARLLPVFACLHGRAALGEDALAYPLEPLALERTVLFPTRSTSSATETRAAYAKLWASFVAEATTLREIDHFEPLLTTLLSLLERYTWCVPSAAYRTRPDVSLYDHARVTAAFAAALYQSFLSEADIDTLRVDHQGQSQLSQRPLFALLGGDLSGVQRFLYTLSSQAAARTLRGRSLFLQLLSEAAAAAILDELGLPTTNLLYVGGARFYILAPASALEALSRLRRRFAEALLAIGGGDLALALAGVQLSPAEVRQGFSEKWAQVGSALGVAKARRLAELAKASYEAVFAPVGQGGPVETGPICAVCARAAESGSVTDGTLRCSDCQGQPARSSRLVLCDVCRGEVQQGRIDEGVVFCEQCLGFRELGEQVSRGGRLFLIVSDEPVGDDAPYWQRALARVSGRRWYFSSQPAVGSRGALVCAVNDLMTRSTGVHGFRLSSARTPRRQPDEGLPRPDFREDEVIGVGEAKRLGWLAAQATGAPYLGVLRMDVDSLGALFREGLGEWASPSRMASLSRGLRLFFEGWLSVLVREVERERGGREVISVVYAGGDDLFAVGPWDQLPALARAIRRDFGRYCAENPALTISAGIAVGDYHYPIYQFAEEAKAALDDQAKHYRRNDGREKDAISLLGVTLGWEDFDAHADWVSELVRLVQPADRSGTGRRAPRALMHLLGQLAEVQHEEDRRGAREKRRGASQSRPVRDWLAEQRSTKVNEPRLRYGRWLWLAHYQLARFAERLGRPNDPLRRDVEALCRVLVTPDHVATLGLVARWAEYLVRGKE
ncbi:MAG TPA: type III-A CRISPR-associated protein Cas10/Csm1, partial [Chloroflexota bacterium]|nr:type III-A CRISPR-associated protein Cas10/Csm1 [Chloroflexota bacterium]